jgi:hypothetical protein
MEKKTQFKTGALILFTAPYVLDPHGHLDLSPDKVFPPARSPIEVMSVSSATTSDVFTSYFGNLR